MNKTSGHAPDSSIRPVPLAIDIVLGIIPRHALQHSDEKGPFATSMWQRISRACHQPEVGSNSSSGRFESQLFHDARVYSRGHCKYKFYAASRHHQCLKTDLTTHLGLYGFYLIFKIQITNNMTPTLPGSLGKVSKTTLTQIATDCNVRVEDIQDVYCCTPLQRASIAEKRSEAYHFILSFGPSVDIDKFCEALACVVAQNAILRTRIANSNNQGLVQVVVDEAHQTHRRAEGQVEAYLLESQTNDHRMRLGTRLFRSAFIGRVFIATIHHAVMDYWSMTTMLNVDVPCAYKGHLVPNRPPFKDFAIHCAQTNETTARSFWAARFHGGSAVFPEVVPGREILADEKPTRKVVLGSQISKIPSSHFPYYIEAAWALTAAAYLHSDSVAYGLVLSGRSSGLNGLEQTLGPTIVEVPIQTTIHRSGTIERLIKDRAASLRQLQSQSAIWYDAGEIAKISEAARSASRFKTLLNIRPAVSFVAEDADVKFERMVWLKTGSFPLHLECNILEDGFMIAPSSDSSVLPDCQLQRILGQFEYVLRKLVSSPSQTKLDDLDLLNPDDRHQLAEWSTKVPTQAALERPNALSALIKSQSCAILPEKNHGSDSSLANELLTEFPTSTKPNWLAALWLTNLKNINELVPAGAIGEVVMELHNHSFEQPCTLIHPSWAVQRDDKQTQFLRTGDLGRFSPDGEIQLLGRIENRIKLRGFTIQLEQLEKIIRESGAVRDCVVCTKIVVGRTQLVAVTSLSNTSVSAGQTVHRVAVDMTDTDERIAAIRSHISTRSNMQVVPDIWHFVEALPYAAERKVDRKAVHQWLATL